MHRTKDAPLFEDPSQFFHLVPRLTAEQNIELPMVLAGIDPASLTDADRLNRELFRRLYQGSVDSYRWGLQYLPINQRGGVQSGVISDT